MTNETPKPWNDECELCYGKHQFKDGETFFHVLHAFSPDAPINICQICYFRHSPKLISKYTFKPSKE